MTVRKVAPSAPREPWPRLAGALEQEVSAYHGRVKMDWDKYVALSAAVSAKRQADALTRIADALAPATGMSFSDKLEDALVRGIDNGASNAISSWQRRK